MKPITRKAKKGAALLIEALQNRDMNIEAAGFTEVDNTPIEGG